METWLLVLPFIDLTPKGHWQTALLPVLLGTMCIKLDFDWCRPTEKKFS